MTQDAIAWTTRAELDFVSGLSLAELEGYLRACPFRRDWGRIDAADAQAFAVRRASILKNSVPSSRR